MARSENEVRLRGHVGMPPEIRSTPSGRRCANIRLATSEQWKDKETGEQREKTEWHSIIIWNENLVAIVEQYVIKGAFISVVGQLATRKWNKPGTPVEDVRYSTEIVLNGFGSKLDLLDKKPSNLPPPMEAPPEGQPRTSIAGAPPHPSSNGGSRPPPAKTGLDDEIPFSYEWR